MGMFIGGVPGKNPDGVTVSTNSNGLLQANSVVMSGTTERSTVSAEDTLLETITLPVPLSINDFCELLVIADNATRGSANFRVVLFDGVTEHNTGYSTALTTGVYAYLRVWFTARTTTEIIGQPITVNTTTQSFGNIVVFGVALSTITQIRIYGKASSGTCRMTGYRLKVFKDA